MDPEAQCWLQTQPVIIQVAWGLQVTSGGMSSLREITVNVKERSNISLESKLDLLLGMTLSPPAGEILSLHNKVAED